jgi:formate dehydrogenase maturation protein FdhE
MTPCVDAWGRRIRRADDFASGLSPTASLLRFYAQVLREQKKIYESFERHRPSGVVAADVHLIAQRAVPLMRAVATNGPDALAAEAGALLERDTAHWEELLLAYWDARSDRQFFPKAVFQPYAEWLVNAGFKWIEKNERAADSVCPRCNGTAQLSILDAGAMSIDGSSRLLQCATCLATWSFRRVACPFCGEGDEPKLGYYESPAFAHVRVDACETCKRYLKTIDLSRLGLADPLVDEVAGAPLDLWAQDHGYQKVELNLVGL